MNRRMMNRRTFIGCLSAAALVPRGMFGSEAFTATEIYHFKPFRCVEEPLYCVAQYHIPRKGALKCRARVLAVQEGRPVFDTEMECRTTDGFLKIPCLEFLGKEVAPKFFKPVFVRQMFFPRFGWPTKDECNFEYYPVMTTCEVRDRSILVRFPATDGKTYVIEAPFMKCKETQA